MKRLLLGVVLASSLVAQLPGTGWTDQGAGTVLKGAAFAAGLSPLPVCAGSTPPPACVNVAASYDFAGNEDHVEAAQGGAAIDDVHHCLYITGGGHADYYGNQFYDICYPFTTVTRLTDPSPIVNDGQVNLDNTAVTTHTEQGLIYMEGPDAVFKWAIGVGPAPKVQTYGWWITNPRTNPTWVAKAAFPVMAPSLVTSGGTGCTNGLQTGSYTNGGGTGATFTVWVAGGVPTGFTSLTAGGSGFSSAPTQGSVATCTGTTTFSGAFQSGGVVADQQADGSINCVVNTVAANGHLLCLFFDTNGLYDYDPSLDTGPGASPSPYTLLHTLTTNPVAGGTFAIDPIDQVLVVAGANEGFGAPASGIYAMSLASGTSYTMANITSSTTGCSGMYANTNPGLKWDSSLGKFTGYSGTGNSVILFDYPSLTCTTQTYSNGPTEPAYPLPSGTYDRYAYFKSLNVYLVNNNALGHMFLLNLSPITHGLGHSTFQCVDVDGDGYGVGPLTVINTTSTAGVSAGATSVTLASVAGISGGSVLRFDLVANTEKLVVSSVVGSTINFATPFLLTHSSGVIVTDQNCIGPDADDQDATVWTAAQAVTKYGSLAGLFSKIGGDIIADNPIPNGSSAAIAAGYSSPHATWYLAPTSPSGGCIGTSGQCTGSDTNPCTLAAPCVTFSRLQTEGYIGTDMVLLRDAWNGNCTPKSGTSSLYSVVLAYPGEKPLMTGGGGNSCSLVGTAVAPYDYIVIDGLAIGISSAIGGGSQDIGTAPVSSSAFHDILFRHIEGAGGTNLGTGIGWVAIFNGLNNFTVEYSNFHGNDCGGGSCQHGMYNGSRMMVSANVIYRRNLAWQNDSNGLTFNGQCFPGCQFLQNVAWSNGISGITLEQGVQNGLVELNLMFSNSNEGLTIYDYPAACVSQGTAMPGDITQICPFDQTGNLIENNTVYGTGNVNVNDPNNTPEAGCPGMTSYCEQSGIGINNSTSPLIGSLSNNTFRNNVSISYGYSNHYPPALYGDPSSSAVCDATCQAWVSTSVWDHNLFFQSDGNAGTGTISFGPGSGFGFQPYTCSTATSVTTMTNCQQTNPLFASASIALWNNENQFYMQPQPSSPLTGAGGVTGLPTYDLVGNSFAASPNIGAYGTELQLTPTCAISPGSLPGGTVGVPYSQNLSFANCSAGTWSISSGSLPAGLSGCNSGSTSPCTISGTPTTAGTSSFTATYSTASNPLMITISAASVTVTSGISGGKGISGGNSIQ